MQTAESVVVPVEPASVFPFIDRLDAYPHWLGMVHAAVPIAETSRPTWSVELRARVGPFARSKQLRMERVAVDPGRFAAFERAEIDGRDHARWSLRAEVAPVDGGTLVTMHLAYDGALWTGGLLEKVLDDQVRRGRIKLSELVSSEPTQ